MNRYTSKATGNVAVLNSVERTVVTADGDTWTRDDNKIQPAKSVVVDGVPVQVQKPTVQVPAAGRVNTVAVPAQPVVEVNDPHPGSRIDKPVIEAAEIKKPVVASTTEQKPVVSSTTTNQPKVAHIISDKEQKDRVKQASAPAPKTHDVPAGYKHPKDTVK